MRIEFLCGPLLILLAIGGNVFGDYAATVLEDNPMAYYRFEDAAGSEMLADSSGNEHEGYEVNEVDFGIAGIVGSAGEFFGPDGQSSIVLDLNFDPSESDFTIESWLYSTGVEEIDDPDNPGEFIEVIRDQQVYISQKDGTGLGRSDMLISANRQLGSFIGGATTNAADPLENDFVEVETWFHFVMSYVADDEEIYFYVNGEPSDLNPQFPGNNGVEPADGDWVIGSHKNQGAQFFEGLLDEIAFYDFRLSEERIKAHYDAAFDGGGVPGDFDGDSLLTAADIDLLSAAVRDNVMDPQFDLDNNGLVDNDDRVTWVKSLKRTWFGDADLNGEFGTADLVKVFQAGKFELDVDAGWADGDWTGDNRFGTSDLVGAFQDGGFEQGVLPANAVPEPATGLLAFLGFIGLLVPRLSANARTESC